MKPIQFTTIIFIFFMGSVVAQESNFLNEILLKNKKDSIFLAEKYITNYSIKIEYFDEDNFREWWSEMPNEETPSITTFFENFDLGYLRSTLQSNKNDSLIDFKKLNKLFIKIKDADIQNINKHTIDEVDVNYDKNFKNTFLSISKPIFNSSKTWAICIITSSNPYYDMYSGGQLLIYQKLDCKWILYHKFYLWLS